MAAEKIADLVYEFKGNTAPLVSSFADVEKRWADSKRRVEASGIVSKIRIDTADAEKQFKSLNEKLERSIKPVKIKFDFGDFDRKATDLERRLSRLSMGNGIGMGGSVGGNIGSAGNGNVGNVMGYIGSGTSLLSRTGGIAGAGLAYALGASSLGLVGAGIGGAAIGAAALRSRTPQSSPQPQFSVTANIDQVAYCPSCGAANKVGTANCVACGADLIGRWQRFKNDPVVRAGAFGARMGGKAVAGGARGIFNAIRNRINPPVTLGTINDTLGGIQGSITEGLFQQSTRPAATIDASALSSVIAQHLQPLQDIRDHFINRANRRRGGGSGGGGTPGTVEAIYQNPPFPPEETVEGAGSKFKYAGTEGETISYPVRRPGRIGRVRWKGAGGAPVGFDDLFDPTRPSSMSAQQMGRIRMMQPGSYEAEMNRAFSNVSGEGSNIPSHMLDRNVWGGSQPQGSYGEFSRQGPMLGNGGFFSGGGTTRLNSMGGFGRFFNKYQAFGENTLGLSPRMAGLGVAGGVGLAMIHGLNTIANSVNNFQANGTQAMEMSARGGDFRYMAGLTRDQMISGTMGSGGGWNTTANVVTSLPGIGKPLLNIAGAFSGTNAAIDRNLQGARIGNERADTMRQVSFSQRSSSAALASANNTDKYAAISLNASEQIERIDQQKTIAVEEARRIGGNKLADQQAKSFEDQKTAIRTIATREEARARRTDNAHFFGGMAAMNRFGDSRSADRAGIADKYADALNSDDPTTRNNARMMMGRELGNETQQYRRDTYDLNRDNVSGGHYLRSRELGNSYHATAAAREEIAGRRSDIANARERELRDVNNNDPLQHQRRAEINAKYDQQERGAKSDLGRVNADYRANQTLGNAMASAGFTRAGGDSFAASMKELTARFVEAKRTNKDFIPQITAQYNADRLGMTGDFAQKRIGINLDTRAISTQTKQQQYLNVGNPYAAEATGIVEGGIADITRANVEFKGTELAGERKSRITEIKRNVAERLKGITQQLNFGNRATFVSGYTTRGDAENLAYKDVGKAEMIAKGAAGSLDTAATKTDATPSGAVGSGGFTPQQASQVVTILQTIADNIGVTQ